MKIVKVICSTILFLIIIAAITLYVVYLKNNKETSDLTDQIRNGTTGKYIKLSEGITHYELAGPDTGKVVILIHGFSVPYYIWDANYNYLVKQGFKVLRYDMYGRGFSDRPDAIYNNALYRNQLLDLIKQLHLKTPVNLMGVSFGGRVAADFAATHAELVNKVVLVDPGYNSPAPAQPQWLTSYYEARHGDKRAESQLTDFKYPQRHPDWVGKYRVQMQYKGFRNALVSTMYNYDYNGKMAYSQLNSSNKKVLLIWGKEDHTVPFRYSDSVRSVLKCDFFPVGDAVHLPMIEQADEVNRRVVGFLAEITSPPKGSTFQRTFKRKKLSYFYVSYPNPHPANDDCVFSYKYTVQQRLKHYPFSKATKIVAVSFEPFDRRPEVTIDDTIPQIKSDTIFTSRIHVLNGVLNYSSLKEVKQLDSEQINKLTDIIYNTRIKKPNRYVVPGRNCYNPRNGLVFYNSKGRVFDYLEVCFECIDYSSLSDKITIGTYCNQKYDLFRQFFSEVGVKFGTEKRE